MKSVNLCLIVLFIFLQYELWLAPSGIAQSLSTQRAIALQQAQLGPLRDENVVLMGKIKNLKENMQAIESRARDELGMIKQGETFYQLME